MDLLKVSNLFQEVYSLSPAFWTPIYRLTRANTHTRILYFRYSSLSHLVCDIYLSLSLTFPANKTYGSYLRLVLSPPFTPPFLYLLWRISTALPYCCTVFLPPGFETRCMNSSHTLELVRVYTSSFSQSADSFIQKSVPWTCVFDIQRHLRQTNVTSVFILMKPLPSQGHKEYRQVLMQQLSCLGFQCPSSCFGHHSCVIAY